MKGSDYSANHSGTSGATCCFIEPHRAKTCNHLRANSRGAALQTLKNMYTELTNAFAIDSLNGLGIKGMLSDRTVFAHSV